MSLSGMHKAPGSRDLLLKVLRDPASFVALAPQEMDLAIRLLRRARLLGRVAVDLQQAGAGRDLPGVVKDQFDSARITVEARQRAALWEVDRLAWALQDLPDVPIVLLKGCAYAMVATPNARGRTFADVDVMVPERDLPQVEAALQSRGWRAKELDAYDEQYYRRWGHEIPPLVHGEREVEVDLHHRILRRTARLKPSPGLLFEAVRDVPGSRFKVLAPVDMVLHAVVHLFYGGEMDDALRELVDIDELVRHFAASEPGFWEQFWYRAKALDLARPAFYGLRYAQQMLGTPVPGAVAAGSREGSPAAAMVWSMDRLVPRALFPQHPDAPDRVTGAARMVLYARSHWVKMPPGMLAGHLLRKSLVRLRTRTGVD
jgi:hypothetical protein